MPAKSFGYPDARMHTTEEIALNPRLAAIVQYHVHQYRCAQNPQNIKRRRNVNYSQQNKRRELQHTQQTVKAAGIHGMGNGE
mgnify:CR=1 FL=1